MKESLAAEGSPTRVSFGSVTLLKAFLKRHTWVPAVFTEVAVIPLVGLWKDSLFFFMELDTWSVELEFLLLGAGKC